MNKRNKVQKNPKKHSEKIISEIEKAISICEAEINKDKVKNIFKQFSGDPENINQTEMWKAFRRPFLRFLLVV